MRKISVMAIAAILDLCRLYLAEIKRD